MAGEVGGGHKPGQVTRIESLGRSVKPEDVWNAAVRAGADPARVALSLSHVLGEVTYESFSADKAVVQIEGVSIHPGSAKGIMVNALTLALGSTAMNPKT